MTQPMLPINPVPRLIIPGHELDTSSDPMVAIGLMISYLNSTYNLQAADTKLEDSITSAEAKEVSDFENSLTAKEPYSPKGTNYIWELENLDPKSPNYNAQVQILTQGLSAAQSKNQSKVKIMDGNNSTAQNTLSQNAQVQQGAIASMGSINSIAGNLARILQG